MINKTFGRLTAVAPAGKDRRGSDLWVCRCSCGKEVTVTGYNLRSGHSKSCGCSRRAGNTKHGLTNTPEHRTWRKLKGRCLNPSDPSYKDYGGRGISVAPEWLISFERFLADMGPKPTSAHTIERRDNRLGYSPANCKWATREEQVHNRRPNRNSRVGISGVVRRASGNWMASITVNFKYVYLGTFKDFFDACCARKSAEYQHWS